MPNANNQEHSGANGVFKVNIHAAQIYIPSLNRVIQGRFAGVHLSAGGQLHKALIGREILRHYTLTYEGSTGKVSLSRTG